VLPIFDASRAMNSCVSAVNEADCFDVPSSNIETRKADRIWDLG
jgi:hypothetical protein